MPETDRLKAAEIATVLGGTVEDLKEYVQGRDPEEQELEALLENEAENKDRKTAKQFLKKRLEQMRNTREIREVEKELDDAEKKMEMIEEREGIKFRDRRDLERQEVLELVGENVREVQEFVENRNLNPDSLEKLLEVEKTIKDRQTLVEFLEEQLEQARISRDLEKAEEFVKKLEEDLEKEEKKIAEDELNEISSRANRREEILKAMKKIADKDSKEPEQEGNGDEEKENEKEENEGNEDEKEMQEETGESEEEQSEEKTDLEKKREIADELDVEMSDKELRQIDLEQIKQMKQEKERREELIDELDGEFDEEDLRKASTSDLEKLSQSVNETEIEKDAVEETEEDEKGEEEMKEEAEEDLQMLMGAGKQKDDEEESKSLKDRFQKVTDFRNNVRDILKRGEEEEEKESAIQDEKVLELLDDYEDIEPEEASIKVAHIMKGYLEFKEGVERELTYKELADEVDDRGEESLQQLLKFFRKMHKDEYTGKVDDWDVTDVIKTSRKVVKKVY